MTILERLVDIYKDCAGSDGLFSFEARSSFGKNSYRVSMINSESKTSGMVKDIYKCLNDNHPNYVIKSFEDERMSDNEKGYRHVIMQFAI